jgi:hypothetical protein
MLMILVLVVVHPPTAFLTILLPHKTTAARMEGLKIIVPIHLAPVTSLLLVLLLVQYLYRFLLELPLPIQLVLLLLATTNIFHLLLVPTAGRDTLIFEEIVFRVLTQMERESLIRMSTPNKRR